MTQTKGVMDSRKWTENFGSSSIARSAFFSTLQNLIKLQNTRAFWLSLDAMLRQRKVMLTNVPQLVAGFLPRSPSSIPGQVVWDL
jgi:hypothetical protein